MKKAILISLIIAFLVLGFIMYNTKNVSTDVPLEVSDFYDQFIKIFGKGSFADVEEMLHFEIPEYRLLEEEFYPSITEYEIQSWEKINDQLWAVSTFIKNQPPDEGKVCHHFVGYIDSQMYVMIGAFQVPESLCERENLTRFIPPNALSPNATIFPIE